MPEITAVDARVRRQLPIQPARLIAMLATVLVVTAGALMPATPAQAAVSSFELDGLNYTVDDNDVEAGAAVTGFATPSGQTSLSVPSTVSFGGASYAVTSVADWAFAGNADGTGLSSVSLPDSITTIGEVAFAGNELTSITLPGGLTAIGLQAFGQNRLDSLVIPDDVETIGDYAFYQNGMTSLDLGSSVTTIGAFAFATNQLRTLSVPDSATSIGLSAFIYNSLRTVTLGSSVDVIEDRAFSLNFDYTWEPLQDPWTVDFTAAIATLSSVEFTGPVPSTFTTPFVDIDGDLPGSLGPVFTVTVSYPWAFGAPGSVGGFTSPFWQDYPSQAITTVSFDMGGFGAAIHPQRVTAGSTAAQPGTPTDSARIFGGWFTDAAATVPFSFGTAITKDTIIYAGWNRIPATLSFAMNGHGTQTLAQDLFVGDRPLLPAAPTAPGFSFTGWYTDAAGTSPFDFTAPLSGHALAFAGWIPQAVVPATATLSFDLRGHGTPIAAQTVTVGTAATQPAAPTSDGWTFTGWFADASAATSFDFATPITADLTLHARWRLDPVNTTPSQSLRSGGTVLVTGEGFTPGHTVQVWLHSTPVSLGALTVATNGTVSGEFEIPLATPAGVHHIVLVDQAGIEHESGAITITAPQVVPTPTPTPTPTATPSAPATPTPTTQAPSALASTGADPTGPLLIAVVLLLAGAVASGIRRRKAHTA